MKRNSRSEHIFFGADTPVYLSASVAGALEGRAGLWRKDGVLALVSRVDGPFRVCDKPNSRARSINAKHLAQYLLHRFPGAGGMLPAWRDEAHRAILFAPEGDSGQRWDESFEPLDFTGLSGHRNYVVHRDRVTVSLTVPRRVSVWAEGGAVYLKKDPKGHYDRERSGGETFLRGAPLAAYLRRQWGARRPYIREVAEGVVLSPDFLALAELRSVEGFQPLVLEEDGRTATLCRDHSILLSQEAARTLGKTVSVYACSGILALRSDRRGDVTIERRGGGSVVRSARFYQQAALSHPGVETFQLVPNGGLWVLSPQAERKSIPPDDYFCRMLMGG